ncbi:MAG: hypothetical protein KJ950_15700 [Proteobacteria bacterium]|nr:hypothetical protein [Pseudomonadota bacterium]MBU1688789.1 hypothetical protein [Pseudomonadota bacterium]
MTLHRLGPLFILCIVLGFFFAGPVGSAFANEDDSNRVDGLRKVEYKINIQVNVLRLCVNGFAYDLIEAENEGNGPSIKPHVVEAVTNRGEPLSCGEKSADSPAPATP